MPDPQQEERGLVHFASRTCSALSANVGHRRRNLLKVEGATDIIARGACELFLTTPISTSKKAVGQADKDFLAVARAVSQPQHAL